MPVPALASMAKKTGKSLSTLERYWDDAKKSAAKQSPKDKYAYIIGIVKKRAGLDEEYEFKSGELQEVLKEYVVEAER